MVQRAALAAAIGAATGTPFSIASSAEAGGGCVNRAIILSGVDGTRWFVKLNRADRLAMFQAESAGLEALRTAKALRVPEPLCFGADAEEAWLVLECLTISGLGDQAALGRGLAALHRHIGARHGWVMDNTIGSTPQDNTPCEEWTTFWRERRLLPQLRRAARSGFPGRVVERGERLVARLEGFFPGYRPVPSLLHGDLWGGNAGQAEGRPVVFDPAVYHGDRETDLAMTELFGGFGASFRAAYEEAWPLDAGYHGRRDLYNLYHILNHFNMFGGAYGAQAGRMIDALLAASA
jgi:protein-ribulosamine 3-kinase